MKNGGKDSVCEIVNREERRKWRNKLSVPVNVVFEFLPLLGLFSTFGCTSAAVCERTAESK